MKKILLVLSLLISILLVGCKPESKEYSVYFYNDNELLKTEIVKEGENATPPEVILDEGYEFEGWDQDYLNIKENKVIKAIINIKKVTITFLVDGVVYSDIQTINYGSDGVAPEEPTKEGYKFIGWDTSYSNVKTNLVVNAKFVLEDVKIYTVTYYDKVNGQVLSSEGVVSGNNATPPEVEIILAGYKHEGWTHDGKNIESDLDIYPNLVEVTERYTITLDEGVSVDSDLDNLLYNQKITVTAIEQEDSYLRNILINGKFAKLENNKHSFYIKENTKITPTYGKSSTIEIVYLNDFHGAILENGSEIGLAKIANFINEKRLENPNLIFISGGDMLQGSALSNHYHGKSTLKLLDMMGLDLFTIGNHEFDWGIDTVASNFEGHDPYVSYPLVNANIFKKGTNDLVDNSVPYHIIEKGDVKIGFIGYIGLGLENSITTRFVKDYEFRDPTPIIKYWSNYLRTVEGVEFVVAIGHDGRDYGSYTNYELRNLTGDEKVDLIFNGHTHSNYIDFNTGVAPVIQSSNNGRAVGVVEINNVNGVISVNQNKTKNYDKSDDGLFVLEDIEVKNQILEYKAETDEIYGVEIIETKTRLSREDIAKWLTKLIVMRTGVDVATYNSGGVRTHINVGQITVGDLFEVLPFDNIIRSSVVSSGVVYLEKRYNPYTDHPNIDYQASEYRIATNDYVFDKEDSNYISGMDHITYDGYIRDWVIEELKAQAAKGLKFSVDNDIETRISSTNNEKGDIYGTTSFVFANR